MKIEPVGEFLSMLKDNLGLEMIQSEIINDNTVVFRGLFPSGRILCGDYKVGSFCHLYVQHRNFDPLNVEAIADFISAQKEVGLFLDELSNNDLPEDQEEIKKILGLAYWGLAWGSSE